MRQFIIFTNDELDQLQNNNPVFFEHPRYGNIEFISETGYKNTIDFQYKNKEDDQ